MQHRSAADDAQQFAFFQHWQNIQILLLKQLECSIPIALYGNSTESGYRKSQFLQFYRCIQTANSPRIHNVTIGGNTCDCWDLMVQNSVLPKLRVGDTVAIMDVGGYAQVLANNFNTIKRASVVMISPDGTTKLIRRRDRYSEMFGPELDVLKLAGPDELEKYNNIYRVNIDEIWRGGGMTAFEKKKRRSNGNGNGNGHMKKAFESIERQFNVSAGKGKAKAAVGGTT